PAALGCRWRRRPWFRKSIRHVACEYRCSSLRKEIQKQNRERQHDRDGKASHGCLLSDQNVRRSPNWICLGRFTCVGKMWPKLAEVMFVTGPAKSTLLKTLKNSARKFIAIPSVKMNRFEISASTL